MLRRIFRELDRTLSIAWLILLGLGVLLVWWHFGIELAALALFVALVLGAGELGGLVFYSHHKAQDEHHDALDLRRHEKKTRGNPTIR